MRFIESLPVAAVVIAMVFAVLVCLYAIIKAFSLGISAIGGRKKAPQVESPSMVKPDLSSGELRLYNVDERTAAMIMAIVSDESGIPLSELVFKTIRALNREEQTT